MHLNSKLHDGLIFHRVSVEVQAADATKSFAVVELPAQHLQLRSQLRQWEVVSRYQCAIEAKACGFVNLSRSRRVQVWNFQTFKAKECVFQLIYVPVNEKQGVISSRLKLLARPCHFAVEGSWQPFGRLASHPHWLQPLLFREGSPDNLIKEWASFRGRHSHGLDDLHSPGG